MKDRDSLILENLYSQLLLEKDHRQKMVSFGIPEDIANYLHNFNNKYSIWFADKIKNMSGFQQSQNKLNWINVNLLTKMQGIMDWVRNTPNVNLKQYNWDGAVEAQEEYHNKLQAATLEGRENNKIIKKYNDGFYWVDLETKHSEEEAKLMGHCASTDKGDTLYSLRKYTPETQTLEAFVTMAICPDDGIWCQCKGKKNSKPKPEYYSYIANILIDKEVFVYRHEYDSAHDFTNQDLKEYVEKHRNEIQNSDDILEKIEENNISYKDFKKILDEYSGEFDNFSMDIDSDYSGGEDDEYIRADYYFQITLNYNEIDIPNIKEIIKEHGGEFYDRRERENLDEFLEKSNIYPSDGSRIHIEASQEDKNFYISTYLSFEEDTYFGLNDQGLNSFRSQCNYIASENKNFDKEKFIDDFKIFALLEGWWSNEFSEFTDKVEEEEYSNVIERKTDKNFDFTIKYNPFTNLLEQYRNYDNVMKSSATVEYLHHRDLNDEEREMYPYAQYLLDYFKYAFHDYLRISEFSVKGKDNWTISIQETFRYENRKDYDLQKDLKDLKKIDDAYERIKNGYYKLCNDIIVPMFESSRPMTSNDVYWKKEELDAEIAKVADEIKEYGYTLKTIYFPVYDKETNKNISTISLRRFDKGKTTEEVIKDSIDVSFQNRYRKYPKYNKTLIENFVKEIFPKQLTFKDYLARK